jgi:hypothetical protein
MTEKTVVTNDLPPETINVLGKTFTVHLIEPDQSEDEDGSMILLDQRINIRLQPAAEYNSDTMLHELIHAVDEMLLLKLKEPQVHQLAVGLMSIFNQNKELMEWMLKK